MNDPRASTLAARARGWAKSVADIVVIVGIITLAKTAIAEPYYVPSGSMEPTLLIGDELLATKYPYGYSAASLPLGIVVPGSERYFGTLPARGDIVVFRWPGDRSQVWVKRVVGLPGDRVQMRTGQVWLNGTALSLRPDGIGTVETDDGATTAAERLSRRCRTGARIRSSSTAPTIRSTTRPRSWCRPVVCSCLATIATIPPTAACRCSPVASGLVPVGNLIGRVDALVGSWDLGMRRQPIWTWPQGLRLSRFFTAVH